MCFFPGYEVLTIVWKTHFWSQVLNTDDKGTLCNTIVVAITLLWKFYCKYMASNCSFSWNRQYFAHYFWFVIHVNVWFSYITQHRQPYVNTSFQFWRNDGYESQRHTCFKDTSFIRSYVSVPCLRSISELIQ